MPNAPGSLPRSSQRILGLLLVAAACLMMAWPALAQTEGGTEAGTEAGTEGATEAGTEGEGGGAAVLFGTLRAAGEPIEGANILVEQDGEEVGQAASDENGQWSVEVPGGGTYQVTLDQESLPEGIGVRDPDVQSTKEISVQAGKRQAVLFPLIEGEGGATGGGSRTLSRVVTLFVSGIQLGSVIAITSIGLSLIFGVTGLVNFAHGEMVTFGAIAAIYLNAPFGIPNTLAFLVAALLAVSLAVPASQTLTRRGLGGVADRGRTLGVFLAVLLVAGAILWAAVFYSENITLHIALAGLIAIIGGGFIGYAMEGSVFGPLRRRNVGLIAMLVISIGLSILLRYGFLIVYGGSSRAYRQYTIPERVVIGPLDTTWKELAVIGMSVIVLVAVGLLLQRTKLGTAMRAVADNRDLAESSGIDVQRVIMATWVAGGALAAYGGVMQGLMQAVQWDMGFKFLLLMFAGVILGGLGTAFGAVVGGLIVGIVTQMSTLWFSVEMKLVFAFAVLILVLLFRPQGVLGRKERIG